MASMMDRKGEGGGEGATRAGNGDRKERWIQKPSDRAVSTNVDRSLDPWWTITILIVQTRGILTVGGTVVTCQPLLCPSSE